ncbi:hypothetical protein SAMN04487895_108129 [Paenibacillus sophorae]|uniref:Uncharacterized protein n=1 Tax=Paenibacillus sophorae TaxID=1333845 RepID=A0A1H8Q9E1_9BACL|nr:hypothetical protein [Paenibacillus sophorae]QWU15215.1 hypothetical protein KP014_25565 [Paenibacillus sophorae]SEO50840.1 hypothetical protein SAMN04487895_108129 [Paenibacillus sophorae]
MKKIIITLVTLFLLTLGTTAFADGAKSSPKLGGGGSIVQPLDHGVGV